MPATEQAPIYRPHDLLTIEEAADEFRMTIRHLRYLRSNRLIRTYKVGNRVKFRWIDLHDHIEAQAIPAVGTRR